MGDNTALLKAGYLQLNTAWNFFKRRRSSQDATDVAVSKLVVSNGAHPASHPRGTPTICPGATWKSCSGEVLANGAFLGS